MPYTDKESFRRSRSKLPYLLAQDSSGEPGLATRRKKLTVDQFASLEYLPYIRQHLKSWRVNERMLRCHVSPIFGHRLLADIKRREIQQWRHGLLQNGYTIGTSNRCFAALSSLFSYAEYLGYIPFGLSPCYRVATLPRQKRQPYLAPPEKMRELVDVLKAYHCLPATAILLMILTGARKSEILKAQWSDVDWENGRMRSVRGTHGPTRWIDLGEEALGILKELKDKNNSAWLFPGSVDGKPLSDVFKFWNEIRKSLGVLQMKLEDLRYNCLAACCVSSKPAVK